MTRGRFAFFLLSTCLVLPIMGGALLGASEGPKAKDGDSLYKYLAVFADVLGLVRQNYVEETDLGPLMDGALDGTVDALDPFSEYVPPEAVEAFLVDRSLYLERSGLRLARERGALIVAAVATGSPAEAAELKVGDLVAAIDEEPTREMPLWRAGRLLAAEAGTQRSLQILRFPDYLDQTLVLGTFRAGPASYELRDDAAVLSIESFGAETTSQVARILEMLRARRITNLVVDLRGASWGSPEDAYSVAALFADGDLGALVDRDGRQKSFIGKPPAWTGSLAVLVDPTTMGPGEVLAVVLKQRLEAPLVGGRTFGYAGRQGSVELSNGGRLFLVDAFYSGPDSEPIRGSIEPDEAVAAFLFGDAPEELGEGDEVSKEDRVLDRALEMLRAPVEEKAAA